MDKELAQLSDGLHETKAAVTNGLDLMASFLRQYEEKLNQMRAELEDYDRRVKEMQKEEWEKLAEERRMLTEEIACERERLESEKEQMKDIQSFQKNKVVLDVGGKKFTTSLVTLRKDPESVLAKMFSGRYQLDHDEADGSYFVDRDGRHFHHILNYLRMPEEYEPPKDSQVCEELLKEARFYRLDGLLQLLGDDVLTRKEVVLPVTKKQKATGRKTEKEIKSLASLAQVRVTGGSSKDATVNLRESTSGSGEGVEVPQELVADATESPQSATDNPPAALCDSTEECCRACGDQYTPIAEVTGDETPMVM